MKRNLLVVQKEDLCLLQEKDEADHTPDVVATTAATGFRKELSSGCSICLEPFVAGDTIMHSIDVKECRHVFHESCIVAWLVRQGSSSCPCCRQEFVGLETPVTSLCSQEQFQEALGPTGNDATEELEEPEQLEGEV